MLASWATVECCLPGLCYTGMFLCQIRPLLHRYVLMSDQAYVTQVCSYVRSSVCYTGMFLCQKDGNVMPKHVGAVIHN
jgi:hypothetical protein